MEIVLFKDITTEEFLTDIEAEGKKYEGLYVEMEDAKQRKYVKDKASSINSLLKTLDRARINKSRDYKVQVEEEALKIKERLDIANEPFTLLIDEHKAERAKVLAEEKIIADKKALLLQIKDDHEDALTINELFEFKKSEVIRLQKEHEESIKLEAAEQARTQAKQEAKEKPERVELEKLEAIQREEQAKLTAKQAEEARIAAEEKAKQDIIDAEKRSKIAADNAESKRIADIEQAKQDVIFRQQEEKRVEDEAAAKREANKKYLAKVHNTILAVLLDNGIDEPEAKTMIKLAAKGLLPQLTINY